MYGVRNVYYTRVYYSLITGVYALVNLVNDAERYADNALEGYKVEDSRDGAFASGLAIVV